MIVPLPASGEPPEPIDNAGLDFYFSSATYGLLSDKKTLFQAMLHPGKERVGRCVVFSGIR